MCCNFNNDFYHNDDHDIDYGCSEVGLDWNWSNGMSTTDMNEWGNLFYNNLNTNTPIEMVK